VALNPERGYVMTRRNPEQLRKRFDLGDDQVTWLTTQSGDGCVDPSRQNLLAHAVMEFFQRNKNAIVLIDGIESIVVYNDFNKAVKVLELINDFVMQYRSYLIIPMDPTAFEPRERAIIERNFEIISVPGTGSRE
jgi:archaellum biogenesis ATPase FlaH